MMVDATNGAVELANTDSDVGRPQRTGKNPTADETSVELLDTLSARAFTATPPELRLDIAEYFRNLDTAAAKDEKLRKQSEEIRSQLAQLARSG